MKSLILGLAMVVATPAVAFAADAPKCECCKDMKDCACCHKDGKSDEHHDMQH